MIRGGSGSVLIASSITCCPSNTFSWSISAHITLDVEDQKRGLQAEQTFATLGEMILPREGTLMTLQRNQKKQTSYRSFTLPAANRSTSPVNVPASEQLLLRLVSFNHAFVVAERTLFQPLQVGFLNLLLLFYLFQMPYSQIHAETGFQESLRTRS